MNLQLSREDFQCEFDQHGEAILREGNRIFIVLRKESPSKILCKECFHKLGKEKFKNIQGVHMMRLRENKETRKSDIELIKSLKAKET